MQVLITHLLWISHLRNKQRDTQVNATTSDASHKSSDIQMSGILGHHYAQPEDLKNLNSDQIGSIKIQVS